MTTGSARFFVTGANGQLGRLVVAGIARRAGIRDAARAAPLLPPGVAIREGDYDRPETLDAALAGAERLLLISSNAVGVRVAQHRNVVDAAKRVGVARIAYTSVLHADVSRLSIAREHRETEALIEASGLPCTLLRNGWYTENYAVSIPAALQHGAFIGSAHNGRISGAARADYAEAAAVALIGDAAPVKTIHELAGDQPFTLAELAAELSRQSGRDIPYADLSEADHRAALIGVGVPDVLAALFVDFDAAAARGDLFDGSRQLSRLIGRTTTPLAAAIAAALEA